MTEKFEQEIELIKNPAIKNIAKQGVDLLPDYFFKVPASSTGKYHPSFALGEGGLYRHVRAAVGIAVELFRIYNFAPDEQDIIITVNISVIIFIVFVSMFSFSLAANYFIYPPFHSDNFFTSSSNTNGVAAIISFPNK